MELSVNSFKQKLDVTVSHRGHQIAFLGNVFGRKSLCDAGFDVFQQINEYWATLPMAKQDQIFEVYKEVDSAFELVGDNDTVYSVLNNCIKKLLALHPLEALEFFLATHPAICVPETVKELPPDPTENMFTSEKTYTRRDYFPLLALSLFLRTVLPIWGQYIDTVRRSSEMNRKEFIAMQLLNGTGLLESPAMNRLRVYINAAVSSDDIDYAKTLDCFSSEDIGFLYLAMVCVKRICLADLRGTDNRTQIIATIFKFMAQKTFNPPDSNITIKREEGRGGAGGEDTGKHSIMESYRKRTTLSLAEIAEMEYALSDYVSIALRLEPSLTIDGINTSVASSQVLMNEPLTDVQIILAGWLIKDQITPHSLYYVAKPFVVNLLGALEAVLWKWGYEYLAIVLTSQAIVDVEEVTVGNISSREQIEESLVQEIRQYYPFEWTSMRKGTLVQQSHPVIHAIDHVVDYLVFNAYRATATEEKLIAVFGEHRRKVAIFSDIKNILAKLIVQIEKRNYQRLQAKKAAAVAVV